MKCNYLLSGLLCSALMVFSLLSFSQTLDWAKALGGADYDEGSSIALNASGNVYTTGYFNGTADFDPGAGVFNLSSAGFSEVFVHKTSQTPVLNTEEFTDKTDFTVYPNPNNGSFSIIIDKEIISGKLIIINAIGQIVYEQNIVHGTNAIITDQLSIGLYNYNLLLDKQLVKQGKLIVK